MNTEIDVDTYTILNFWHVFLVTDKRLNRQSDALEHAPLAIRHWAEKKVARFAKEASPAGFARTPITFETERDPSRRGTEIGVWFSFATMPEHPGLNLTLHHDQGILQIPRLATSSPSVYCSLGEPGIMTSG